MNVKTYFFTDEERGYIVEQILLAKNSLDECCDNKGIVLVDFIKQEDADEEYKLIDNILGRLDSYAE